MKQRVLVVEDEEPLRRVIARNLEARGHDVAIAATAAEALAVLAAGDVDLMFLDIDLPDRTGWDVVRELRGGGRDVPFVVVSAIRIAPPLLAEFKPLAYLPKPFPLEALLRLAEGNWAAEASDESGGAAEPAITRTEVETALETYDRQLEAQRAQNAAEQAAQAAEEVAEAKFDQLFAEIRVLVIEPAMISLETTLLPHGHRAEVIEEEHAEVAPGWTRGTRVTLALLPKGWDLDGERRNQRPRISFAADPAHGTVQIQGWIVRPGQRGEGGQRAVYAIDDLTADAVDRELQRFLQDVLGGEAPQ